MKYNSKKEKLNIWDPVAEIAVAQFAASMKKHWDRKKFGSLNIKNVTKNMNILFLKDPAKQTDEETNKKYGATPLQRIILERAAEE